MAVKIRLARGGRKNRPYYTLVVADARSPRDGCFLEKVGRYNPILPAGHPERVIINAEAVKSWLDKGAVPTDRVLRFLELSGLRSASVRNNPEKAVPGKKRAERTAKQKAAEVAA